MAQDAGLRRRHQLRDGAVADLLAQATPRIDVYFDNVGGDPLEAAIGARLHLRVAVCGMVSQYNDTAPSPPATCAS